MVGLGQCSLDHVVDLEGMPEPAGKQAMADYARRPGGQIATALLACTRLGLRAALISSVGDDEAAPQVLAPLREAGVELAGVRVVAGAPSQLAVILVDRESGERTVLWHRDPRLSLEPSMLRAEEVLRGRALLLDAGDPEASAWAAGLAREAGRAVVLDADTPAPGIETLLRRVDFPVVSREFAAQQFGTEAPERALEGLAALGARLPVVTLGAQGCVGLWQGRRLAVPAYAVETRDTTGAGDVFHAAFATGLLDGLGPLDLLRWSSAAAALNCRAPGAQGGLPSRSEIESLLLR